MKNTIKKLLCADTLIFTVSVAFLAAMHSFAFGDRMALILYYLVAVGSAYALFKRKALGFSSAIVAILAATMFAQLYYCLLYTSPSPRDATLSRMPSSA